MIEIRKIQFRLWIIIALMFFEAAGEYCEAAQVLSDAELDNISAAGFDVNIEAVLALRQAAAVNQSNIGVTSGFSNTGSNITNTNSASIVSGFGSVSVQQKNMAYVVASEGDISFADINNLNYAYVDSVDPDPEITQENVAMLIAMNGAVRDSSITNINQLVFPNQMDSAVIKRNNVSIIIAENVSNYSIVNMDEVICGASAAASGVNTFTYSYNDLTAIVSISE